MNDITTLIKSSIISLIILIVGLFMLCVNRGPRVNVDEPLIEGGGIEAESDDLSDNEFLSLLESSDNEISEDDDTESASEALLVDESYQDTDSDDEDLSEILKLLNMDDDESANAEKGEGDSDELERILSGADSETDKSSGSVDATTIENLETEIGKLENILDQKNVRIDSIKQAIEKYDEQIAQTEGSGNYPGGATDNNSSVQFASYATDEQERASSEIESKEFNSASTFHKQYDIALSYFHNNQYSLAALAFEKILQEEPFHDLADNCQYWIGECYFARGNYYQAIVEFEKVFSFDADDKKDDAQLMLGLAYMKAGKTQEAKNDFSWFLSCYQTSEYYKTAQRYVSEL